MYRKNQRAIQAAPFMYIKQTYNVLTDKPNKASKHRFSLQTQELIKKIDNAPSRHQIIWNEKDNDKILYCVVPDLKLLRFKSQTHLN